MKIFILFIIGQIDAAAPQSQHGLWFMLFVITAVLLLAFAVCAFAFYSKRVGQFKEYKASVMEQLRQLQQQAQQPDAPADEEPASEEPLFEAAAEAADTAKIAEYEKEIASLKQRLDAANLDKANLENRLEISDENLKIKDKLLADMSKALDDSSRKHPAEQAYTPAEGNEEAADNRIAALQKQLNEANRLREHAESEAAEYNKLLTQCTNDKLRLQEDLNSVNHAYDQYQIEYQEGIKSHEADLSRLRNEYASTIQHMEQQYSRQLSEQMAQKESDLSELRDKYEAQINNLKEDFAHRTEQTKSDCEQRIADLVAKHSLEIENAKRAFTIEASRISDDYERKINDQSANHTAEIRSLAAAHHTELAEKTSLLEQKERQLDMMQTKCQAEMHRITEECEDRIARVAAAKDSEMSRMAQEADNRIKLLTERVSTLYSQVQSSREAFVACVTNRFAAMTPGVSRLASDAKVIDGESMAAYLAENMLDAFGYAVSDFKHAVDKLDDTDSIQMMQAKLRVSLVEKWVDQNGWIAILCQLTAYARIPAMHASLRDCGIDTMLLARLQADATDLLGCFDVSIIVPSVLADDFDSASMEPVNARTIIDRINPNIMPRDHVGKVFDLVLPGFSSPAANQKPRVVYF